ncbi:MAG: hypothetical protein Q8M03_03355 [Legionella sp.]|nr:hypothetical protein [Legionella sp.]
MYKELYPHLKAAYNFDNFEEIIATFDKHFPQLFNLKVLENEAKFRRESGSYVKFFSLIMQQLKDLYTVDEVAAEINKILQKDKAVRDCFHECLIFVPPVDDEPSPQLGFLEKTATGQLKVAEPVTFLDMLRVTWFLQRLDDASGITSDVTVLNLDTIQKNDANRLKRENRALMVNFNRNAHGTPKWGVVDLRGKPQVYCETPLLEAEKKELETRLKISFKEASFGTADNLPSTGYAAIAWLDKHITNAWNFDTNADFNVLFSDYVFAQFRGDTGGVDFRCFGNEYQRYFTPELRAINSEISHCLVKERWNGYALIKLTHFSMLGNIDKEIIPLNDLAATINVMGRGFSKAKFNQCIAKSFRSYIPRFAHTLSEISPPILQENENEVSLTVPDNISKDELKLAHQISCRKSQTNSKLLKYLSPDDPFNWQQNAATAMVLTLFRARAKKRELNITLPDKFQLTKEEQNFIINLMADNPYVTQMTINDNASLRAIKKELLPVFARNRWLAENDYRPPIIDNYWVRAAKYWLLHLNEQMDLLDNKQEHVTFKKCVREMGSKGLETVLDFLNDENHRDLIDGIYGKNKPAFYADCEPSEANNYITLLLNHFSNKSWFPFSQFGIAYQHGQDSNLLTLFNEINRLEQFEKITLSNCLQRPGEFTRFLRRLTEKAYAEKWVGIIVIPELEDEKNVTEEYQELRSIYANLNNIISHNRHLDASAILLAKIKSTSDFSESAAGPLPINPAGYAKDELPGLAIDEAFLAFTQQKEQGPWSLSRGSVVQLQLQQQQEIQQSRQIQQEQQKIRAHAVEEVIVSELVTYENIDALLGEFFENYAQENEIIESAHDDATTLKAFFHSWISANPEVRALNVIHSMTLDAAKMLLRKHTRLTSGLSLDNLPKGFYTQRDKDGLIILCYSPEMGYSQGVSNPLTVDLMVNIPLIEAWEGDFRLLTIEKYMGNAPPLQEEDFQSLVLFETLQPPKDYQADFEAFCEVNSGVKKLIDAVDKRSSGIMGWVGGGKKEATERVLQHWLVFLQAWQFEGEAGVNKFLNLNEDSLSLDLLQAQNILFKNQSPPLQEWVKKIALNEKQLRAIGQVYYRFGDEGVALLLAKFRQIESILGHEFFESFHDLIQDHFDNYTVFISERFFTAIDDMITKLQPHTAQGIRYAWLRIASMHLQAAGSESVENLWRGFDYFITELQGLGLELQGNEFDEVPAENMLVCMDRILETLKLITTQEGKVSFLRHLSSLQLTHGGVHYAVQNEGFRYFNDALELHDFAYGSPTYKPDLSALYAWNVTDSARNIQRTLASCSQFSQEDYHYLSQQMSGDETSKDALVWLLFTKYHSENTANTLDDVNELAVDFKAFIARHLHQAVFRSGNRSINVSAQALIALQAKMTASSVELLANFPDGLLLETISILWQANRWSDFDDLLDLHSSNSPKASDCPDDLFRDGYKLATLFGINSPENLCLFHEKTRNLKPVVQNELRLLIKQILSIDYEESALEQLINPQNWQDLLATIGNMNADKAHTAKYRIALMKKFNERDIVFKYSTTGHFRALENNEQDMPDGLGFFVDHQLRLWNFMRAHIAIEADEDAKEALAPLMRFFKKLQLNRTYLNEIEPLLAMLEKTDNGLMWPASFFYQMLKVLQPDNDKVSFPIPLLEVMIKDITFNAKPINDLRNDFPDLEAPLRGILLNTIFSREQQTVLCKLALKEFHWRGKHELLTEIIELLSPESRILSRDYALSILVSSKNDQDLVERIEKTRWLLVLNCPHEGVMQNWTQTTALWLKAITKGSEEEALFNSIRALASVDELKRGLILHIMAWSTLNPGLREMDSFDYELTKARPLTNRLRTMSVDELVCLAQCYPGLPSPGTDDLRRLIKRKDRENLPLATCVNDFLRNPYPEPRMDFKVLAKTREADLQRMFAETRITNGHEKTAIPAHKGAKLSLIFADLKALQAGDLFVHGTNCPIDQLSQAEIAAAFKRLSLLAAHGDAHQSVDAEIWALLFEALGRTTRKYPHLAQQFALIANDVCVDSQTRVLQLATGEGKSHFVAMRAAKHAAMGKVVDICTAKRSLAERDMQDYQDLFNYLQLTSSNIQPKTSREVYVNTQIHYSTAGDLSLFLDEQNFNNNPIIVERDKRVGLFDEFDFIRFEEGRKTEYNYARPTGRTPKQMTWFYQAVNKFYENNQASLYNNKGQITVATLRRFAEFLQIAAGDNEEKQSLVLLLLREPIQFVSWLQSAHDAHGQVNGVSYTVREENILVGDTTYPMKEIIPLSADNQIMIGSTFSLGVQQLLAALLNNLAKEQSLPQNYHIHPESNIISSQVVSQRMKELWGTWEGFSGTISASQAQQLNTEYGTEVLHVSTNQEDKRTWHEPAFYTNENERLQALVKQIRLCLEQKKSILFCCKNDKQVKALAKKLERLLTEEEFAHFIFYTNDDAMSANEILAKKRTEEGWHDGKKDRAVGLVASGFGRGDNVNVETVFLFNVNDINDLLQKGGRTARNGEEGEVFQFYRLDKLQKEQKDLENFLQLAEGSNWPDVDKVLAAVQDDEPGMVAFKKVMLLREYVFSLQNAAHQGYHEGLAQYSGWGMSLLGKFNDPLMRSDFASQLTSSMKNLEKCWLDISSNPRTTPDEKIRNIEEIMSHMATNLHGNCVDVLKGTVPDLPSFSINPYPLIKLEMVLEKTVHTTQNNRDLSIICAKLAVLPKDAKDSEVLAKIPGMLRKLAEDDDGLHSFATKLDNCDTLRQFANLLTLAFEHVEHPSPIHRHIKTQALKAINPDALLKGVPSVVKKLFLDGLDRLLPPLAERIIHVLCEKNILSAEGRIEALMPLMTYLGGFSTKDQTKWGLDYINNRDNLTPAMLTGPAMSFHHASSLWKVVSTYTSSEEVQSMWTSSKDAIKNDPTMRLRLITKWEALTADLDKAERKLFFTYFIKVMGQLADDKDWDTFTKLVDKTHAWWNKGNQNSYQEDILSLWKQLADTAENLPLLNNTLHNALKMPNKNWLQVLLTYTKLTKEQQVESQLLLEGVLARLNGIVRPKAQKRVILRLMTSFMPKVSDVAQFNELLDSVIRSRLNMDVVEKELSSHQFSIPECRALLRISDERQLPENSLLLVEINKLLDLINLDLEEKSLLKTNLLQLTSDKFPVVSTFIRDNQADILANPQTLKSILKYARAHSISKAILLAKILLKSLEDENCSADKMTFIQTRMDRLASKSERDLGRLLQLIENDAIHREQLLFDEVAHYLENKVHYRERNQVKGLIDFFYAQAIKHRGNPDLMFEDERLANMFDFNQKNNALRDHRIIWMHLLNQQAFVTSDVRNEAHDRLSYQWDYVANQALLQKGFDCYIRHTAEILQSKPDTGLSINRHLNPEQQTALLKLSDELATIGRQNLAIHMEPQTQSNVKKMETELKQLLKDYGSFWVFKNAARKEQSKALEDNLQLLINMPALRASNTYEKVFAAINEARFSAIESDGWQNMQRFFKLNRSGESRYLNTLNQMQDMVVRHWAQDSSAIHSFQVYRNHNKREFCTWVEKMSQALRQHHEENYPPHGHPGRAAAFFTTHKTQARIRRLKMDLEDIHIHINVPKEELDAYLQRLRDDIKILPGHLATLAKEVLNRGAVLSTYLEYEANNNARNIIAG